MGLALSTYNIKAVLPPVNGKKPKKIKGYLCLYRDKIQLETKRKIAGILLSSLMTELLFGNSVRAAFMLSDIEKIAFDFDYEQPRRNGTATVIAPDGEYTVKVYGYERFLKKLSSLISVPDHEKNCPSVFYIRQPDSEISE